MPEFKLQLRELIIHRGPPFPVEIFNFIFPLIVALICAVIYWRTKELYELTNHQGIRYFRYTFLFFGIAFFVQFMLQMTRLLFQVPFQPIRPLIDIFFLYAGSMAVLCLVYSVLWKKLEKSVFNNFLLLNIIALIIAITTLVTHTGFYMLLFQGVMFLGAAAISYETYKKSKKKKKSLHFIYVLLFLFWLLTLLSLLLPRFLFGIQLTIDVISLLFFVLILKGVEKRLGK